MYITFAANYIIKRAKEKVLVLIKTVPNLEVQVVAIVLWQAIPEQMANFVFDQLHTILGPHGIHTPRGCEFNQEISCVCQGIQKTGASISLGCSYQGHINACKFKVSICMVFCISYCLNKVLPCIQKLTLKNSF